MTAVDPDEFEITPEWLAGDLNANEVAQAGFGEDGTADQMGPGPVLAGLVHAATKDGKIMAALSDDDLIGVIAAAQRVQCRAVRAGMAATGEYAARHAPDRDPAAGRPTSRGWHGSDELGLQAEPDLARGCSQPASRCDLDHTTPWHHGGPSCPCNLASPCRR